MLENLINSPFLISLALTLLHFLWQGLIVAAVLKSALLILNNNKPQLRYALSSLAMLVNLLLPLITFIVVYRAELLSANSMANPLGLNGLIHELNQPDALFSYKELTEVFPALLPYISVLWLTTITLLSGKLLIEISTVNKLPQQGTLAPSDKLQARFNELAKQINLKIAPRLLISLKVEVPMAIGWLKPVVLIPATMITGLNSAQLEMLILHELAHIRRHDYLVNFLQTLVEILLFFHPAVLWVSKQMRNEREYCSDDIAVQHCGDAIAYAHTLADTASLCTKAHHHTIPDMAMAASGGDLKQRVIRLVDHHCAPQNNISKWFASAAIIFSVLLLSSKQLLTMPLLDIWHDEPAWNQANHSKNNSVSSNEFPNSSIAQQLLAPLKNEQINQALLNEQAKPIIAKSIFSTVKTTDFKTAPKIEIAKQNQIALAKQQTILSETKQFNAKLDSLSSNSSIQPKETIKGNITGDSMMVEEAFIRTNSSNPYQVEIAQLAVSQEVAIIEASTDQIKRTQKTNLLEKAAISNNYNPIENRNTETISLANVELAKSNRLELPANSFPNTSFSEKEKISSAIPIWQNAEQLKTANPIYPSVAKRKGIEIEVKVNFTIDIDGQIKDIKFARQNKINYFKSSIRSAIKKWRFLPAKVDDQPVESQMSKVFAFSLQS